MTLQLLVQIILWSFALVLLFALMLAVFIIGRQTIRNNPKKASIFIKNGSNIELPEIGRLHEKTKEGCSYKYGENIVMIPQKYEEVYYRNKRMVFVNHIGKLIALPFDKDIALDNEKSENLIYELCSTHIGADSIRALKGTKTVNVIIIALIAFALGAIIVFGFTEYMKSNTQPIANIEVPKEKPTQPIIEVK